MIRKGLEASRDSKRLRMILPVHRVQEAEVQRIVNFLQPGTYIRPHLHPMPHATESIVLLKGSIRFFTFDDTGAVITDTIISASPIPGVVDIEPETWHTFLVLEDDTVLFECKKGPYDAESDKKFAAWSPQEGHEQCHQYMEKLRGT